MAKMEPTNDLLLALKRLGAEANTLTRDTLNKGGCCVFASLVARMLEQKGIRNRVVVAGYGGSIDESRPKVKPSDKISLVHAWRKAGIEFCHVGVLFRYQGKYYTYDSETLKTGRCKIGRYPGKPYKGALTIDEAESLAATSNWNYEFNRKQIPALEQLVDKHSKLIDLTS